MLAVDLRRRHIDSDFISGLQDFLLDAYNGEITAHPIIAYLAVNTEYPETTIIDSFRFYCAFKEFNHTEFTELLKTSDQGFDFWFQLWSLYDNSKKEESLIKIMQIVGRQLN